MPYTDSEILSKINDCIYEVIVKGQEVEFDGKIYKRANIKELTDMKKYYQGLVNAQNGGHPLDRQRVGVKIR